MLDHASDFLTTLQAIAADSVRSFVPPTGAAPTATEPEGSRPAKENEMTHVNVYEATTLISVIEAEHSGTAWRAAITSVKAHAFSRGCTEAPRWYRPRGRFSFQQGPFTAISALRAG